MTNVKNLVTFSYKSEKKSAIALTVKSR